MGKQSMQQFLMLAGLFGAISALPSQAAIITFNNVPVGTGLPPGSGIDVPISPCFGANIDCATFLDADGFRFTSPDNGFSNHAHLVSSPFELPSVNDGQFYPSNGTQYIGLDSTVLTMQRIGGGTFSLSAFDAAEGYVHGSILDGDSKRLRVDGSLAGGGVVSAFFDFDGVNDGTGPLADFQRFILPGTFSSLVAATFTGLDINANPSQLYFSIDNLNVNVTPEPGSLTLLGLGVAALVTTRRRTC
jgi:hypothetical protein